MAAAKARRNQIAATWKTLDRFITDAPASAKTMAPDKQKEKMKKMEENERK